MKKLLIFPCNSTGLEIAACFSAMYEIIGFVDDEKSGQNISGYPVFDRSAFLQFADARVVAVNGGPLSYKSKPSIISGLNIETDRFETLIHPTTIVANSTRLGRNVVLFPYVVITNNVFIDNHTIVLPGSVIHHDVQIGQYNFIGSNVTVSGNVQIGKNCFIASGSTISNNLTIAEAAMVGIGSTVIQSIPANECWAGSPARKLND